MYGMVVRDARSPWHLLLRASSHAAPPPPLPQLSRAAVPHASLTSPESPLVAAFHSNVERLKTQIASFAAHFDAISARIDTLVTKQNKFETILNALTEAQQVVIAFIATLTEEIDSVAHLLLNLPALRLRHAATPNSAWSVADVSPARRPPNSTVQ